MLVLRYSFLAWFKRYHFLYVCGFLIFFQPLRPFTHELLVTSKNLTESGYLRDVVSIETYSNFGSSVLLLLLVSCCSYNVLLLITCLATIASSALLWKGSNIVELRIAQGLTGAAIALRTYYYASVYACPIEEKNFPRLTAYIRAVPLLAQTIAAFLAQIVISCKLLSYEQLAFLAIPASAHAFLVICCHFPVLRDVDETPKGFLRRLRQYRTKLKEIVLLPHFYKWCIWSALMTCARTRFQILKQPFWDKAQSLQDQTLNNGALEGISCFLAMLSVLLAGILPPKGRHDDILFCVISLLNSAMMFGLANIEHVWDSTIIFLLLEIFFYFGMSRITAITAQSVSKTGCFAIAFGLIGLLSSGVNVILSSIIRELDFTFQEEFLTYAVYHATIAALMLICWLLKI